MNPQPLDPTPKHYTLAATGFRPYLNIYCLLTLPNFSWHLLPPDPGQNRPALLVTGDVIAGRGSVDAQVGEGADQGEAALVRLETLNWRRRTYGIM